MIQRIQVIWEGGDIEGTIHQLSTYVTRLVELRLIFDERDDEVMIVQSPWKSLLENVREKKRQVHLDGEAERLHKGRHWRRVWRALKIS